MSVSGGILNIYKPVGMTSFDVVSAVRKIFNLKRVGHCGTLDPFAQGVLPVCVGRATSIVRYMENYDKRYKVVISFGESTDTQDCTGKVIFTNPPSQDSIDKMISSDFFDLRQAIDDIVGESNQLPPMFSAIKINGTPLYKYARKGIEIERAHRAINIYSATLECATVESGFYATVNIHCSKGTYIRTVCDDLGNKLGYGAHAKELIRTACGPFGDDVALTLSEIEAMVRETADYNSLFGISRGFYRTEYALTELPKLHLNREEAIKIIQGQKILCKTDDSLNDKFSAFFGDSIWMGVVKSTDRENLSDDNSCRYIKAERIFIDVNSI